MPYRYLLLPLLLLLLTGFAEPDPSFAEVCPGVPLQTRETSFSPGGIILTAFDGSGIWPIVSFEVCSTRMRGM